MAAGARKAPEDRTVIAAITQITAVAPMSVERAPEPPRAACRSPATATATAARKATARATAVCQWSCVRTGVKYCVEAQGPATAHPTPER